MSVVSITKEEIILCSGMSEAAFGKTNYSSIITQSGLFFNGTEDSLWSFSDVKAQAVVNQEDRLVFYSGKNPFTGNAKTLLQYFEDAGKPDSTVQQKKEMYEAGLAICSLLTKAAKEKIQLPKIGAGGILVELNEEQNPKILFLPQRLFEGSVAGLNEIEYANQNGCWLNTTIFDLPSLCFQRAVIAYKMLTGRFPFPNANLEERNADILDKKFLPIELCVNGIDASLATEINKALKLNSNVVNIPGKNKRGKASEDLTPTPDFPLDLLENAPTTLKETKLSDEELNARAEAYLKTQASKVKTKRAIRRNTTRIIVGVIIVIVLSIMILNYISSDQASYTSVGLTSTQTSEAIFQGINEKDTILLDNLTSGKTANALVNTISRIYVIGKQRKAYAQDNGFASPENWIVYLKDESYLARTGLYGVSNVKIDGKPVFLDTEVHAKKDKIPPLREEKNIQLTNGLQSVHECEYFMLHSEGDTNELTVELVTEIFTLTYKKNRWILTDISETKTEPVPVNDAEFYNEYFNLLRQNQYDTVRTVQMLSYKYPWLPQTSLVERENQKQKAIMEDPFGFF